MSARTLDTSQQALDWLLQNNVVVAGTRKDPETFASVQGFLLSDEMREKIGTNLVQLVAKSSKKRKRYHVTLRDAFLTSSIAALLQKTRTRLGEDDLTECANIIFALLPIERLEQAGLADRSLQALARDRSLVIELQRILRVK